MKKICISKNWTFSSESINGVQVVDLPHDYSINLERDSESLGGGSVGFFSGKNGNYKKYMSFGNDEHYILNIDGAYMCSRIFLNDNFLDAHPYGYTPYLVDLSDWVRRGSCNKIEITTQNLQPSSRWYTGAGIYRDLFLWSGGKVRIEPWDMFVKTAEISGVNANLEIDTYVTSDLDGACEVKLDICDNAGNTVCTKTEKANVKCGKNRVLSEISIENAILWDVENPYLYLVKATVFSGGAVEDSFETAFGVRTIEVSADEGFKLNGVSMKLRGGCLHHDHGGLGSAEHEACVKRKIKRLKEVGFNAVRIAHNPPSLAMLEECDRQGMLVMDEAFDMWNVPKSRLDYSLFFKDWWDRDISYMVLRDRNHPCVISYSIGNEIPERNGTSSGYEWCKKLSDEIRKYDKTRFVTQGICDMWNELDYFAPDEYKEDYYNAFGSNHVKDYWDLTTPDTMKYLDIVGYNYLYTKYKSDSSKHSNRIIWGSETHTINFFDSWNEVLNNKNVIGDFTWTAYDNLGEVGTGRFSWAGDGYLGGISLADYPWRACFQGDLDLCGFRRPQSYFREAVWIGNTEPKIFTTHPKHYGEAFSGTGWHWRDVLDTWTFEDEYLGKPVNVEVYTDADEIEFVLNGKSLGKVKPKKAIAAMTVPYERGEIKAISYKNGIAQKSHSLFTTKEPYKIVVTPEKTELLADNRDFCFYDIEITDIDGKRIANADFELECEVSGGGFVSIFSGCPNNEDQYGSNKCHAFMGRALAVSKCGAEGAVILVVKSESLKCGSATVNAIACDSENCIQRIY